MKYYSIKRPITPGSFPKPEGNNVLEIHNFDSETYCEKVGREVWGYIVYEHPLAVPRHSQLPQARRRTPGDFWPAHQGGEAPGRY